MARRNKGSGRGRDVGSASALAAPRALEVAPDMRVYSAADLRKMYISPSLPASENYRNYYGAALDMGRIENAIRAANYGNMIEITDLEGESLSFDPHLSGVVAKRFGQIRALDYDLTPSQHPDAEADIAERVANETRQALVGIPDFQEHLYELAWSMFDGRAALEIHLEDSAWGKPRWRPKSLGWIHPRRLSFGSARELRIIDTWRSSGYFTNEGVALQDYPGKFIYLMPRIFRDYPEREGFGPRTLYWSFFKRFSWRWRMKLTELFGLPWRIVKPAKGSGSTPNIVSKESLASSKASAEKLGGETTAAIDAGLDLQVIFPDGNSGELFQMTSAEVDAQQSKLVLWQTGTTDATGVRAESIVHKTEQDLVLAIDATCIDGAINSKLVVPLTSLNYGVEMAQVYAPKFQLRAQPARNREAELTRTEKVISLGLPVSVAELREIAGTRTPDEGEPFVAGSTLNGFRIVDPVAQAVLEKQLVGNVTSGETSRIEAGVEALGVSISVNEVRASQGLGPKLLPDGTRDPKGDMTIAEAKALAAGGTLGVAPTGEVPPPIPAEPPVPADREPGQLTDDPDDEADAAEREAKALLSAAFAHMVPQVLSYGDPDEEEWGDEDTMLALAGLLGDGDEDIELGFARDPKFFAASRSDALTALAERSAKEAARATESIVAEFIRSVPVDGDIAKAWRAVSRASARINSDRLARVVEQASMRALMVGAAEADWEAANDVPATFAGAGGAQAAAKATEDATEIVKQSVVGKSGEVFVRRPFAEAIRDFAARHVLTKPAFKRLAGANKRRAFTIANLAKKAMIEVAHSELTAAIGAGTDLRKFRAALAQRFTSAGWTPMNPSRVELVFRNAVSSANATGRHAQMTQPHILKARPYWQIQGPKDARKRPTHAAALGKVLAADDPFWERAPLPWGHNCRDRKVSRSEADIKRLGLTVSKGTEAWAQALPDEGWD